MPLFHTTTHSIVITNKLSIKNISHLAAWEIDLLRKLDFLTILGSINIFLALIAFSTLGFTELNVHFYIVFGLAALVFTANRYGKYFLSCYLFFSIGIYILSMTAIYLRLESYSLMYFFPLTMSIVQLLGRRELFKHLIVWVIIYFICISCLMLFSDQFAQIPISEKTMLYLRNFNIILSFLCGLTLIVILTWNNIVQDAKINKSSVDKELLLAELFHRVKNNLNIVTSLLNIRKNASENQEVKDALEECRSRIYSMALVHQQMYSDEQIGNLNLRSYLSDLITSIEHSFGDQGEVTISNEKDIYLSIAKAVPAGLILNELLTNVYKHAQVPERKLEVSISIESKNQGFTIRVSDNGPGLTNDYHSVKNLGLDLIQSLSEQIDAHFDLINNKNTTGCTATLTVHTY